MIKMNKMFGKVWRLTDGEYTISLVQSKDEFLLGCMSSTGKLNVAYLRVDAPWSEFENLVERMILTAREHDATNIPSWLR